MENTMDYSQTSTLHSALPKASHVYERKINEIHTNPQCKYEKHERDCLGQNLYIWIRFCVCKNYTCIEKSQENIQAILKDPYLEIDGLVGTFDKNYVIKSLPDKDRGYVCLRSMTKNAQVPFGPGDTEYN